MLFKKSGFPHEGDLVIVKVEKILPTSVFAKLTYYDNLSGVLHISEIAPGRIRNLNDYVSIGKTLVCQVLRTDERKGHIDLSLRRVSEVRQAKKLAEIKQERKAERLLQLIADQTKGDITKMYAGFSKVFEEFEYIHEFFQAAVQEEVSFSLMKLPKKQQDAMEELVRQKVKPPVMEITGVFSLKSHENDGISTINAAMKKALEVDEAIDIKYNGAAAYPFVIRADSFEHAEGVLKKAVSLLQDVSEKNKLVEFSYSRQEGKQVEE